MKPSKVFVNFYFICYIFIGNVNGQQGILVSPTPSVTENTPSPIETSVISKSTIFATTFLKEAAPSTVTPILTIKPSIYTDEAHFSSIRSAVTGAITKVEISSITSKPPPSLNVQATTIQNEPINNYRKNIEPRNASDDKTIPSPAAKINLTITSKVTTTTPDGKTISPPQLMPTGYAYGSSDYTGIASAEITTPTTVFRASKLADVETFPELAVSSTVLSTAVERSTIHPEEVPFGAEAITMSRVAIAEASSTAKAATTVVSHSSPSRNAEVTTIRNETIENYEKDVELRNAVDNKTMPIPATITMSSPHLVPRDDAYENDYYTGPSPMETTSANKPTTLLSAAIIAAAETSPEEAIPSVALSVIDIKPSIYSDENDFRRGVTANSEITTTALIAKATMAKNDSINNYEMNVQPRTESIGDKMTETSSTAAKLTVATEATAVVSDGKITLFSQLTPKDVTSESGHGHYNVSS